MFKREKIAALITGIALFFVAALFSIGIFLGALDFGGTSMGGGNFLSQMGDMLISVYGICSMLIPTFFFVAGAFCLSAKWSIQRAFILLVSVIPFFTLVVAEQTTRNIMAEDSSPVAFLKILTLMAIALLLVIAEYLLAIVFAGRLEERLKNPKANEEEGVRRAAPSGIPRDNLSAARRVRITPEEFKAFQDKFKSLFSKIPITKKREDEADGGSEKTLEMEDEAPAEPEPEKKIQGVWSIDADGNAPEVEEIDASTAGAETEISSDEILNDLEDSSDLQSVGKFEEPEMGFLADDEDAIAFLGDGSDSKDGDSGIKKNDDIDYEISFEDETERSDEGAEPSDSAVEEFIIRDADGPQPEFNEAEHESEPEEEERPGIPEFKEPQPAEENVAHEEYYPDEADFIPQDDEYYDGFSMEGAVPEGEDEYGYYEEPQVPQEDECVMESTGKMSSALEGVFSKMDADARAQVEREGLLDSPEAEARENDAPAASGESPAQDSLPPPIALMPKRPRKTGTYLIPTDLLTAYDENPYWVIDDETNAAAKTLKDTLSEFKIDAEITGIRKGPVVTMFEMLPAPGVKLGKIVALADNIALRLAASSVRIIAPIPGKRAVGIEVPNKNRAIVSFRECVEQQLPEWKKMAVPVILGKDIQGETQIMDLVKTPHLLIAGSTGAGKSVCVNSMILSILYKRSPNDVKLILIDPKIVELKLYNGIPHLLTPVITEPKKAMQALQYCLCEMERRYAVLDGMGCRDISNYNKKIVEQRIATERLPYMIVIIDEFADLMATTGKQLESVVARLAAMSRAVGIHLVLATQRPSIDVITGLIKANIPSRIAFMVASKTDSRIIVDQVGAEKLLGKGDMLYASSTDPFPVRIQGAFVSDQEVENVVKAVKEWGEPEYIDDEIFVDEDDGEGDDVGEFEGGDDPLYEKALAIVVQAGKASASYIQRRLSIGYNRAARLVEEMEERGIVGPANGSKPREVIHIP